MNLDSTSVTVNLSSDDRSEIFSDVSTELDLAIMPAYVMQGEFSILKFKMFSLREWKPLNALAGENLIQDYDLGAELMESFSDDPCNFRIDLAVAELRNLAAKLEKLKELSK